MEVVVRKLHGWTDVNRETEPKREEVTIMILINFTVYQNSIKIISRRMRWAGHVACMEQMRNAYKILVRRLEEKRSLGRLKCQ
jgi:hypothetical protein